MWLLSNTKHLFFHFLALHFEVGDQKSPAKPLQDLIVLKENAANGKRPVRAPATDAGAKVAGGVAAATADARSLTGDGISLPSNETTKGEGKPIKAPDD